MKLQLPQALKTPNVYSIIYFFARMTTRSTFQREEKRFPMIIAFPARLGIASNSTVTILTGDWSCTSVKTSIRRLAVMAKADERKRFRGFHKDPEGPPH